MDTNKQANELAQARVNRTMLKKKQRRRLNNCIQIDVDWVVGRSDGRAESSYRQKISASSFVQPNTKLSTTTQNNEEILKGRTGLNQGNHNIITLLLSCLLEVLVAF